MKCNIDKCYCIKQWINVDEKGKDKNWESSAYKCVSKTTNEKPNVDSHFALACLKTIQKLEAVSFIIIIIIIIIILKKEATC